MTKARLGQRP